MLFLCFYICYLYFELLSFKFVRINLSCFYLLVDKLLSYNIMVDNFF